MINLGSSSLPSPSLLSPSLLSPSSPPPLPLPFPSFHLHDPHLCPKPFFPLYIALHASFPSFSSSASTLSNSSHSLPLFLQHYLLSVLPCETSSRPPSPRYLLFTPASRRVSLYSLQYAFPSIHPPSPSASPFNLFVPPPSLTPP
ncbi:hypothetical protein Pcinc_041670 [Petrolisthes cinctipes]|uniref:Uncharacterized protein n=1 Tax=Petrolisthes cinctipes TaxID=88211 RepID=A0AAE1EI47_PETCI|nr:hypothetical protein Pcinc_041670 [Petrolisthes cinctipes]